MSQRLLHPFWVATRVGLFAELPSVVGSGVGHFCIPSVTGELVSCWVFRKGVQAFCTHEQRWSNRVG